MKFFKDPRAYLDGLGTTSLLVIGALLVLVTASSLVGFSDWGAASNSEDVEDLVIDSARPDADGADLAALAARAARGAVPASGAAPAAAAEVAGDGTRQRGSSARRRRTGASPLEGTPLRPRRGLRPASAERTGPAASPGPGPGAGRGLRDMVNDLADTTEEASGGLGRAVGEIDPGLGGAVGDAGGTVGDALRAPGVL